MAADESNKKTQGEPANVSEVGSDPLSATVEYRRHPIYSPSEWLYESISSILALGLLIAIAIIFSYMDNKRLDAWNSRVSLNATISILTTACTTALMHGVSTFIGQSKWLHFKKGPRKLAHLEIFDGASRGVWGSLLLLAYIPWNLATIGALVSILRLGFSPFAQQVVLIEQRNVTTPDSSATFGYAHTYSHRNFPGSATALEEAIPQDPGMQSAIYQGLYGINTIEPFSCSGTCQWSGSYIALGFRSECKNVTEATLQTARCETRGSNTSCNMTAPNGLGLRTEWIFTNSAMTFVMNASAMQSQGNETTNLPEIARFAIWRSTPDHNFNISMENVTECSLFLTAYEYSGASANGPNISFAHRREVDFGVDNPWSLERFTLTSPLYTNETSIGNMVIPRLEITYSRLSAIEQFFASPSVSTSWNIGNARNRDLGVAAALSGETNITERFERMATAMTNYVRYGPDTQTAQGELIESVPFVSIRWGYFVVPIVTEGFAILFAILSIINNRKSRNVPLWKSSTLAVLECRHEERLGLLQTTGKDINQIQAEAQKAEVRLQ
ncbi:hypothetical protein BJX68DRAFT_231065 [Aspergillus pseudodeflectus]|uniref:Uncharacterized protein n=1 Tax=Aspergillus pseudodeflectus TaxID=176178 RepID=A0ABR4KTW6_9EURO